MKDRQMLAFIETIEGKSFETAVACPDVQQNFDVTLKPF
jgi:hypothetical protein